MTVEPCCEVVPDGKYTAADLRYRLAKVRGTPVPIETLRYWRRQIGCSPDPNNLYSAEDLETLTALVRWLNRGGKIPQFVNLLRKSNGN